jgi:hypothetical protein
MDAGALIQHASERERDEAIVEMSREREYSRRGDRLSIVCEPVVRTHEDEMTMEV